MSRGHGHGAVPAALGIAEDGGKAGGPAVIAWAPWAPMRWFPFRHGGTPSDHPCEIGISPSYHPFLFWILMGFFMK